MNDASATNKGGSACNWAKRLVIAGAVLALAGLVIPSFGGSPMAAMLLITLGTVVFIVAGICGATGLIRSGGSGGGASAGFAWAGVIAGVAALVNTFLFMGNAGGAPIHDISTDTDNPPAFVEVARLRGPDDNPVEYSGPDAAAAQREAYPDIEPVVLLDPPAFVFDTALQVATDMGWEIVAADAASGRIEATATTPFVGFKDDVVIRVAGRGPEAVVDIRSKSRVGRGDMGVNARRVREFSAKLVAAAEP